MIRTKKDQDRLAKALIVGVAAVVALAISLTMLVQRAGRVEPASLCPIDKVPDQTVIILDKSDKWDADDIERVGTLLRRLYGDVPAQGRLTIRAIAGSGRSNTKVETLFDKCNPGSEKECNALYQNCRRIRTRYQEGFNDHLAELNAILSEPGESSYSPLFETVAQVVDDAVGGKLSIYLISDLMENGDRFDFYNAVPVADAIVRQYPLKKGVAISANLEVEERRRHSPQLMAAVRTVWEDYFRSQGAAVSTERLLIAD